jgi:hypothetical protein
VALFGDTTATTIMNVPWHLKTPGSACHVVVVVVEVMGTPMICPYPNPRNTPPIITLPVSPSSILKLIYPYSSGIWVFNIALAGTTM